MLQLLLCTFLPVQAQTLGFEEGTSGAVRVKGGKIRCSTLHYKEGKQSLEWNFKAGSQLTIQPEKPVELTEARRKKAGINFWIYNEQPSTDSLRVELLNKAGETAYRFGFRLTAAGWRAGWISLPYMMAEKESGEIASWRITAPAREGRIFIDRITFPVEKSNDRTTPDEQMPYNNGISNRDLWHWCRVWQWEQLTYDLPLPDALTPAEQADLKRVEQRMDSLFALEKVPLKRIKQAYSLFEKAGIALHNGIIQGAPLVAPDELKRKRGEMTWSDLETMLAGFAYDVVGNHSKEALQRYLLVWRYALDQGFAYGSGMGTNHHYGYQVREIYSTAWLMRKVIAQAPQGKEIMKALTFWSALQETRQPCPPLRDELLDTWHTLLMPKTVAAMMTLDERERLREMSGLSRWISSSLRYTPGTIGGIKVDGTAFHHGGFYPAYSTDALGAVGTFVALTNQTAWLPTREGRAVLKKALLTMAAYSNLHVWGIGIGGRHPFGGNMKSSDIEAFAHLALAGDLSDIYSLKTTAANSGSSTGVAAGSSSKEVSSSLNNTLPIDQELAEQYLRLEQRNTPLAQQLKAQGVDKGEAPQGFFVLNYGSAGIYRKGETMVTLKGYTTDVWGAEIYAKDNRYGRYQSYGSVQIMRGPTRQESGYAEEGWDWNRLPGTTTLHLPWEQLDSPLKGTTMARSREDFSGSSSLEGRYGMFAMKLMERQLERFTPDFKARKSVFCFDNRLICLGSDIRNSNASYPTETTLYQMLCRDDQPQGVIREQKSNGKRGKEGELLKSRKSALKGKTGREAKEQPTGGKPGQEEYAEGMGDEQQVLADGFGNRYYVRQGEVHTSRGLQQSRHDKTREETEGCFATAWIDHGKAPQGASYEYMVWMAPSEEEIGQTANPTESYRVLRHDSKAHIVQDLPSGVTAYALFDSLDALEEGSLFAALPAETMVMTRPKAAASSTGRWVVSVCSPALHLEEKSYTTSKPSRPVERELLLRGAWSLDTPQAEVKLQSTTGADGVAETRILVTCCHGQPVEFTLTPAEQ